MTVPITLASLQNCFLLCMHQAISTNEHAHESLILIALASGQGLDEPANLRSLVRALAACMSKVWRSRNVQTKFQISSTTGFVSIGV